MPVIIHRECAPVPAVIAAVLVWCVAGRSSVGLQRLFMDLYQVSHSTCFGIALVEPCGSQAAPERCMPLLDAGCIHMSIFC